MFNNRNGFFSRDNLYNSLMGTGIATAVGGYYIENARITLTAIHLMLAAYTLRTTDNDVLRAFAYFAGTVSILAGPYDIATAALSLSAFITLAGYEVSTLAELPGIIAELPGIIQEIIRPQPNNIMRMA